MKQVVNGLLYDTETAELIHTNDGIWEGETTSLYRTDNDRFFTYYRPGQSMSIRKRGVVPMTEEEAMEWLENNAPVELLLSRFPDKVEEA